MMQKLQELRAEYARGLEQLARLDQKRQDLHRTLLRISGAIQVLEELLDQEQSKTPQATAASNGAAMEPAGA